MGCALGTKTERIEIAADNPFNVELNELIKYADVIAIHIKFYVTAVSNKAKQDIDKIIAFENTFKEDDRIF